MIPSLEGYAKRGVGPQSAGKDFCKQLLSLKALLVVKLFVAMNLCGILNLTGCASTKNTNADEPWNKPRPWIESSRTSPDTRNGYWGNHLGGCMWIESDRP